ncbi:DNA-directed primase/polymerase protein isoform X2 [Phalaenopsis equestris]|uniref:DNA-directed primase/polymerase protein isoform X2 n=1 Tax=Phalaenopsis equestris TaxID=78828 RepID=UPI0009E4E91E|nr:DNA-directed primase/polymerase protein isoform X2 [Phalaenopsis equestris]
MADDHKDDVDRLFACFKCGVSPPSSALKDRKSNARKPTRSSKRGSPVVDEKTPSCFKKAEDNAIEGQKCSSSTTAAIKFRSGKQISPVIFYGSARGVPVKKPSRILRLLQEIRVDLRQENSLISRDGVWATFPRQEEAIRFARTHRSCNVFSYQDHLTGKRRFLASTYDEFWKRYESMDSKFRHHYEVIQEGHPCHLYFDLEFNMRLNVGRNVDEMVDILTSITLIAISEKYSIHANHECVVELDSSTEEKFSRHLIIRLPKAAFKNNSHVGAFVSESKQQVFLESLICRVDGDCEKLLTCKMDLDCMKALSFDTEVHAQPRNFPGDFDSNHHGSDTTISYISGRSPFPALDAFVESIASIGNASGKIQSWYWFSAYGLMVYNMSRNRYCERIGREHKSNHVLYVVDFQRAGYYQKCHDPDCRGYRSPFRPLPWDVLLDSSALPNSTQIENYAQVVDINLDLQVGNTNMVAFDNEQLSTDCCTDMSWWHKAISFAEYTENMRNVPDFSAFLQDEDMMDDDCAWWTDVEKFVSQVE